MSITNDPLIPWEPHNIPISIQDELNRRKKVRGFNYVPADQGDWGRVELEESTGEWEKYKGPMSPWVRFCSNGAGKAAYTTADQTIPLPGAFFPAIIPKGSVYYDKQGFVLFGGKNFYSGYGFDRLGGINNESIIGYMPDGRPHIIDYDIKTANYPVHVPPPEIEKISVTIQKELYRRARVEWVCFSAKQLEYMTPYFLIPGLTCILEWGWNHYDPSSLIDLNNIQDLKDYNKNPYPLYNEHILRSKGNYDVLFGMVTHFEWSIDGNKIRAVTEITSKDRIYTGLVTDATIVVQENSKQQGDEGVKFLDTLKTFVKEVLPSIKSVITEPDPLNIQIKPSTKITKPEDTLSGISQLARYLKETYPEDKYSNRWKELIYGVYYGREFNQNPYAYNLGVVGQYGLVNTTPKTSTQETIFNSIKYDNKDKDFDRRDNKEVWINMGLLVEILNYHSSKLKDVKNVEMFHIDIDDCVISGHPNLISTDGKTLLIPNMEAPKYFYGDYGKSAIDAKYDVEYERVFSAADSKIDMRGGDRDTIDEFGLLADWRSYKVALSFNTTAYRDNLDVIINENRYTKIPGNKKTYEFPFFKPEFPKDIKDTKPYPRRYSGYLKNIYFNVSTLQTIVEDSSVKTFTDVLNRVLTAISNASANFWDLRIIPATGKDGTTKKDIATMKIADYKFIYSVNRGKVYTFDYYDAEGLLQNIRFIPTLSNAQAIRTIYAQTNNPKKNITLSDTNELLDYKFRDRLFLDEEDKDENKGIHTTISFRQQLATLQGFTPAEGSFQVTSKDPNGNVHVRRLVMPSVDVLKLMLDDGDEENNPRYCGIMPGIQAQFTIQGIGGLRTFMMFLVRNLPEPYSHKNIVFRIIDLTENIEGGKWTTTITAGIIPLRQHIKNRLGITGEK